MNRRAAMSATQFVAGWVFGTWLVFATLSMIDIKHAVWIAAVVVVACVWFITYQMAIKKQNKKPVVTTYKIDASAASADLAKRLPEILAENNKKLLADLKRKYPVGKKGPELFVPTYKVSDVETKTYSADEIPKAD